VKCPGCAYAHPGHFGPAPRKDNVLTKRSAFAAPIAIILSLALGFAAGQWSANSRAEEIRSQLEEAQTKARHGQEAVANVEVRAAQVDAHRHAIAASLALLENNPEAARRHLRQISPLLADNKDSAVTAIAKMADRLAHAPDIKSVRSDLASLNAQFEQLIPQPMNASSSLR
jgi:chromosome segregation ATPase